MWGLRGFDCEGGHSKLPAEDHYAHEISSPHFTRVILQVEDNHILFLRGVDPHNVALADIT